MRRSKKLHTAEAVIAASIAVMIFLFLLLGASDSGAMTARAWVAYYTHALAGSLSGFLYSAVLFICLGAIVLVIWSLGGSFLALAFPRVSRKLFGEKMTGNNPRKAFLDAMHRSKEALLVIPAILFVAIAGIAMGEANEFAPARLKDVMVIGWEHALFGNYVFAALGAIYYPHWLIEIIIFSFLNMSLIIIGAGILIAYFSVKRFRELLIAFCIGILLMIPIWLLIPALSPQDRFINNVYNLPMPAQIASAVANYHPQPEIASFLQTVRTDKAGLPALPTSTMPSAHIFWAVLAGYYLFRSRRWLGWIALPFLVASSFGTVLLAQHYFIDIPAGILIAIFAIWLAHDMEVAMETA